MNIIEFEMNNYLNMIEIFCLKENITVGYLHFDL